MAMKFNSEDMKSMTTSQSINNKANDIQDHENDLSIWEEVQNLKSDVAEIKRQLSNLTGSSEYKKGDDFEHNHFSSRPSIPNQLPTVESMREAMADNKANKLIEKARTEGLSKNEVQKEMYNVKKKLQEAGIIDAKYNLNKSFNKEFQKGAIKGFVVSQLHQNREKIEEIQEDVSDIQQDLGGFFG